MAVPASPAAPENGTAVGSQDCVAIELADLASTNAGEHANGNGAHTPAAEGRAGQPAAGAVPELDAIWVASMKRRVRELSPPRAHPQLRSIFRVPKNIRDVHPGAYEPKMISLGPYHRGREHLQAMEKHKWRYLSSLLDRNQSRSMEDYMRKMKSLEDRAKSCYDEDTGELESDQFAEMMLLDGCFLVELVIKFWSGGQGREQEEDPIFGSSWALPLVVNDMLLLENQLPFFVLQEFWGTQDLVWCLLHLFRVHSMTNTSVPSFSRPAHLSSPHHLLHLFHSYILPSSQLGKTTWGSNQLDHPDAEQLIPSATQLKDAEVELRQMTTEAVLDVAFVGGVMHVSPMSIYDDTIACLRNLVAFEQCFPEVGKGVSSHIVLMDCLINTAADVALLKQRGVLINRLSSDDEAARFFNNLCKEAYHSRHGNVQLYADVNRYYRRRMRKWRERMRRWKAELVHKYCSNPWTVFSVMAAFILLLLTFAQTLFTVLSYFK